MSETAGWEWGTAMTHGHNTWLEYTLAGTVPSHRHQGATLDQSTLWLGLCHHADTKAPMAATLDQSTPWLGLCHHTNTKVQHFTRVHPGWDGVITLTPRCNTLLEYNFAGTVITLTLRCPWPQHLTKVHLGCGRVITPNQGTYGCNTWPEYTLAGTVSSRRHQGAYGRNTWPEYTLAGTVSSRRHQGAYGHNTWPEYTLAGTVPSHRHQGATLDQSTPWLGLCHHTDTKAQHLTRVHLGWDCVITPTPRRLWLQHLTRVHLGWDCVITPTPRCNTWPEYTLAGTVSSHWHQGATLYQSTPWLGRCHHTDTKVPMAATLDQSTPWLGLCHHTDTKAQHLTRVHLGWDGVMTPTPRLH